MYVTRGYEVEVMIDGEFKVVFRYRDKAEARAHCKEIVDEGTPARVMETKHRYQDGRVESQRVAVSPAKWAVAR